MCSLIVLEIRSLTASYVHKVNALPRLVLLAAQKGEALCLFHLLVVVGIPCPVVLFPIIKKHHSNVCFPHLLAFFSEPDPSWVSLIKAVNDYVRSTQITQDNFPISSSVAETHLQSPFSHIREHSQVPRMRPCIYLWVEVGDHYPAYIACNANSSTDLYSHSHDQFPTRAFLPSPFPELLAALFPSETPKNTKIIVLTTTQFSLSP